MRDDLLVAKDYLLYSPTKVLLQTLNFTVKKGRILLLLGPNGSGKSTLLKEFFELSNQSWAPTRPDHVDEQSLSLTRSVSVSYLPQSLNREFFIPLTLEEVTQLSNPSPSPQLRKLLPSQSATKLWNHSSGGERQRALLVQVLGEERDLYLLDEPFNHLDAASREELGEFLCSRALQGRTLIVATHAVPTSLDRALLSELNFIPLKTDAEVGTYD